jgi:predicted metal-dependent HD superfamily phosphohydrolase
VVRGAAGTTRALSRHLRITETATLDSHRWTGLWSRLGAEGDGQPVFSQIVEAYGQPARVYHTVEHLEDCLSQFDASPATAVHPDEVEAALWFHDAVYVPGHSENEERSAEFARGALIQAGAPSDTAARVASLILSTRHHTTPRQPDSALLCDIDLSILGRSAEVFDRYQQQIRREYGWVPEPVYRKTRSEILQGFLRRPSIYQTSYFRDLYELAARSNLARAIRDLA